MSTGGAGWAGPQTRRGAGWAGPQTKLAPEPITHEYDGPWMPAGSRKELPK